MASEYVLSCDFEFLKADEILPDEDLEANPSLKDDYVVIDTLLENTYLINSSIYNFLQLFKEPVLLEDVLERMQIDADDIQSKEHITSFFDQLREESMIVSKEENEALKEGQETSDIQEVSVEGYITEEVYKQSFNLWVGLVRRESDMQLVVVKKFLDDYEVPDEASKDAFIQEFTIMEEINSHPAICKLYSLNKEKFEAEIEYVDGGSLRSYIKDKKPPLKKRIELISSLLDGFSFLQQKSVVHGDIHASNFMLTKNENLKIIDFGMSNHAGLQNNEIVKRGGVYNYIPPERVSTEPFQIVNKKTANFPAEVYQLGLIMYFIFYGKIPFHGLTWQILAKEICEKIPTLDKKTGSGEEIPETIIKILGKALQKDPLKRYLNATDLNVAWVQAIGKMEY